MAEGARLESVYTGNRIEGSNPSLSAILYLRAAAPHPERVISGSNFVLHPPPVFRGSTYARRPGPDCALRSRMLHEPARGGGIWAVSLWFSIQAGIA